MGRRSIELVQVLVDRIEKNGYQQRAREDDIADVYKRLTEAEGWVLHWKQARKEAHEAGELMQAEIVDLRQQLDAARAETVDVRRQRNNETDRLNATNAVSVQQRDEIAYLRARLDEERSVSAGLRDKLAEAQQPDVGAMRAFVGKVRACVWACYEWPQSWHKIEAALVELDDEPTTATEPPRCPECERLRMELTKSRDWASHCEEVRKDKSAELGFALEECERLQAFVVKVRDAQAFYEWPASWRQIEAALVELDAGTEPTPVAEPLDAEGGA